MKAFMAAIAICALTACTTTAPQRRDIPVDSRADVFRATLIVRDADTSLALYRDVLGMEVMGDRAIGTANISAPSTGEPGAMGRFVVLRGPDDLRGMIGLIQWVDPPMPDPGPYDPRLAPGSVVFVMRVANAQRSCDGAAAIDGVTMTKPATVSTFTDRNGDPIRSLACTLFDPDANLLELSQRLEG